MGEEHEKQQQAPPGLHVRGAPSRCAYCHDLLTDPTEVVACAACGARQHAGCHREHGVCASCAHEQVLVPRGQVSADHRLEPPKGSVIEVERRADGTTVYSWPGVTGGEVVLWLILMTITVIGLPFLPFILLPLKRWLSKERSTLTLGPDGIEYASVSGFRRQRYDAKREDVGAVRLDRVGQVGMLRLTFDVGVDRLALGSTNLNAQHGALKEPELEWLHEELLRWKQQG